jgi:DNA polymerase IIIc chi subunit
MTVQYQYRLIVTCLLYSLIKMNHEILSHCSTEELLENRNRTLLAIEEMEFLIHELADEKAELED